MGDGGIQAREMEIRLERQIHKFTFAKETDCGRPADRRTDRRTEGEMERGVDETSYASVFVINSGSLWCCLSSSYDIFQVESFSLSFGNDFRSLFMCVVTIINSYAVISSLVFDTAITLLSLLLLILILFLLLLLYLLVQLLLIFYNSHPKLDHC